MILFNRTRLIRYYRREESEKSQVKSSQLLNVVHTRRFDEDSRSFSELTF